MKKLLAAVLCIAVVLSLSVSAFAAASPTPTIDKGVILRKGKGVQTIGSNDVFVVPEKNKNIIVEKDDSFGTFNDWNIYKILEVKDGKITKYELAKEGEDYKLVNSTLKDGKIEIIAYKDLAVCANYNGVKTDPTLSSTQQGGGGNEPKSPKDGDVSLVYASMLLLVGAAVVFGAKKVLSK